MSKRIQLRRGTTAETNAFTGAVGEVTVDTDKKTVVVHDGTTAGGTPLARVSDIPNATTTVKGLVRLATQAEVNAGADSERVVTPLTLKNTIPAQTKTALNASGTAPIYACRAWVNFNGIGTVSISASGNVSSITDNGVGDYTFSFTTAMPHADYALLTGASGGSRVLVFDGTDSTPTLKTTTQVRLTAHSTGGGSRTDINNLSFGVFC